jgi:hypothetical protein
MHFCAATATVRVPKSAVPRDWCKRRPPTDNSHTSEHHVSTHNSLLSHVSVILSLFSTTGLSLILPRQDDGGASGDLQGNQFTMGIDEKLARWMEAASKPDGISRDVRQVARAGEFLEKTCSVSEERACSVLTTIDFSRPILIVRLPDSVYVQFIAENNDVWFTDTGLAASQLPAARFGRTRKLYRPLGPIPALRATARSINDAWTVDQLFQSSGPRVRAELGAPSRNGGTQYIVLSQRGMREV